MTEAAGDREAAFRADVAAMKLRGGTVARERAMARVGAALLVAGIVLGVVGYVLSRGTTNPLEQRDALVLAVAGVPVSVAGLALYLRFSLGGLLRLWLARLVLRDSEGPASR